MAERKRAVGKEGELAVDSWQKGKGGRAERQKGREQSAEGKKAKGEQWTKQLRNRECKPAPKPLASANYQITKSSN